MGKVTKEYKWRMEGMNEALRIARQQGVEALEDDVRKRNFLGATIAQTTDELRANWGYVCANLFQNMRTMTMYALNAEFGFGRKRLMRWLDCFNHYTELVDDLDYMGQHYATLEDYSRYIEETYHIDLDSEISKRTQEVYDRTAGKKNLADVNRILSELEENGYTDAAIFLRNKMW